MFKLLRWGGIYIFAMTVLGWLLIQIQTHQENRCTTTQIQYNTITNHITGNKRRDNHPRLTCLAYLNVSG